MGELYPIPQLMYLSSSLFYRHGSSPGPGYFCHVFGPTAPMVFLVFRNFPTSKYDPFD